MVPFGLTNGAEWLFGIVEVIPDGFLVHVSRTLRFDLNYDRETWGVNLERAIKILQNIYALVCHSHLHGVIRDELVPVHSQ
jgi:hypothetical protein